MGKAVAKTISKADVRTLTVKDETAIMGPLKVQMASLVDGSVDVSELQGIPEGFDGGETLAGLPPSPRFEKKGDAIFGEYVKYDAGVGPNNSRLYHLSCPTGKGDERLAISVWGTTAIDNKFDSAFPPIQPGDRLGFVYLGEKKTARNQNPLKLFALHLKRMTV